MVDAQQIAEKVGDLILGSIKEELKEFRAEVGGQLEGFRIAIESMNKRMDGIERRLSNLEDEMRALKNELILIHRRIDKTNQRIDRLADTVTLLSSRIDKLAERVEVNTIELRELKAKGKVIEDILRRLKKLEDRVFA
ncbi:hypothetical protein [Archaeoglobus sp.]